MMGSYYKYMNLRSADELLDFHLRLTPPSLFKLIVYMFIKEQE